MLKMQRRHAQNAEKSCSKCRDIMLKTQKSHAQNAETSCSKRRETSCSKCRDVMLKTQRSHAQNAETSCSKRRKVMRKMQKRHAQNAEKRHAQNAETSCSKRRETSCSKCKTQNNAHYVFTVQYVFYLIPTLAEVSMSEGTRDLDSFWPTVMSICAQLERHYNTDDLSLAEQLILRAEECTSVLRAYGRVCEVLPGSAILHDVLFVIGELQNYCQHYTEWTLSTSQTLP